MHIVKLHISGREIGTDMFFECMGYYLDSLYGSNQILNEEYQYETSNDGLVLNLFCPEKDSYMPAKSTIYANRGKNSLEHELGCCLEFRYHGLNPALGKWKIPKSSQMYFLKTGAYSPLMDGQSLDIIPLYKIPKTNDRGHSYDNINFWENNYLRVRGLWFNGAVGERWAQKQLQNFDSALSRQGIQCCKRIEELTQVPTYYFLFNFRLVRSLKRDTLRPCPSCGAEWLLEGKSHEDLYAFKCDPCRLISELSSNS